MEFSIDFTKTAQENANHYFESAKRSRKKAEGAEAAIKDLESRLSKEMESKAPEKELRKLVKKEWYERFNWFLTSNSMLVIGGRSAQQNEEINSKYFIEKDLFFHADIFGASLVLLKGGVDASMDIRNEAAQFAACFSRAWDGGSSSVDVYSLKRDQVSKSKEKGSLGTGSFLLSGEREWHRHMSLELAAFGSQEEHEGKVEKVSVTPLSTCKALGTKKYLLLKPGRMKKSDAAKEISKAFKYDDLDYIMQHLPPGSFSIKRVLD